MKYLLFILFPFSIFCQNNLQSEIKYQEFRNSQMGLITTNYSLYFDENQSLYLEKREKINKNINYQDKSEHYLSKALNDLESNDIYKYKKRDEKVIYYNDITLLKQYNIYDDTINLKWEITNLTKIMDGFNCIQALTEFRGRKYVAWFTIDIPLPYGPSKFNGLPGLILEIHDIDKIYYVKATTINLSYKSNEIDNFLDKYVFENSISYSKYLEYKCKDAKDFESNIKTKLPRGISGFKIDKLGDENNQEIENLDCFN